MARAVAQDFLHSMRFHVSVSAAAGAGSDVTLGSDGDKPAGFAQCSLPEASVEVVEYREGTWIYNIKQPGNPTVNDVSLSRGVTTGDSTFWHWLLTVIEGSGEYRADVTIKQFHRQNSLIRAKGSDSNQTALDLKNATPARTYTLKNAFPTRHKVASDLDATSSEISIMELDLAYETFEITEHTEIQTVQK
jgi:phage tail-like protein